ncbi:hypothetical protein [Roseomonas rosulenta]|uniref:hypothetical protein n=1 Tax=Roseomonas rosulenta TaxID=2748667 RepID=UPI0018DFFD9A|nr:hypothetical protein [Roseomonas rosulenta]
MPQTPAARSDLDLDLVLARFPDRAVLVRHLYLTHPAFRSICEDYRLAQDGRTTFEVLATLGPRSELGEYRTLVQELEAELLATLKAASDATASQVLPSIQQESGGEP